MSISFQVIFMPTIAPSILTEILFCVVVARAMVSQFVIGVHPVPFVIEVLEADDSVVELAGAVTKQFVGRSLTSDLGGHNGGCQQEDAQQPRHHDVLLYLVSLLAQIVLECCC